MRAVLDASAAIGAVLGHPSAAEILEVLNEASVVVAPDLFVAEVTSSLWKYVNARQLSIDVAIERLDAAIKLVDGYRAVAELAQEVLREATTRKHSVYDLCYAVLARRNGATLLTIDARLRKLAAAMGVATFPAPH